MSIFSKWSEKIKRFFRKKETKDALREALEFLQDSGLLIVLINPAIEKAVTGALVKKGIEAGKAAEFSRAGMTLVAQAVDSRDAKAVAKQKLRERLADPDTTAALIALGGDKANLPLAASVIGANVTDADAWASTSTFDTWTTRPPPQASDTW